MKLNTFNNQSLKNMWFKIQTIYSILGTQNIKILAKSNHVNSMFRFSRLFTKLRPK